MQVSVNMTLFQRENRYTWLFFVPSPSVHFLLVLYSYKCTCACACAIVHACQTQKSQMWLCSNRVTGYNVTKVFNKFKMYLQLFLKPLPLDNRIIQLCVRIAHLHTFEGYTVKQHEEN